MSINKQNPASAFDLNGFLDSHGDKKDKVLVLEFGTHVLKFNLLSGYLERQQYAKNMIAFVEKLTDQKRIPAEWKELGKFTEEEASAAFLISEQSADPKISQLDALKMVKGAGSATMIIVQQLAEASKIEADASLAERVDAQKKD